LNEARRRDVAEIVPRVTVANAKPFAKTHKQDGSNNGDDQKRQNLLAATGA
jgi:hypothetical protein